MASKKFTQFNTANNTSEPELSVGVKSGDNFKRANNLTATTAPTVSNDGTQGYTVGSTWFDTVTTTFYICSDSTTGAAVWRQVSSVDGEWTPSVSATNDATVTVSAAYYQYSGGSICQFSMLFDVDMDVAQSETNITIFDLPVPTIFTNGRQVIAAVNVGENITAYVQCIPQSSGSDIVLTVESANNGDALQGLAIVGHYEVL